MATQLKFSLSRGRGSQKLCPPTHMWLTHAPSGESSGRKMCAGLDPGTHPLRHRPKPGQPSKATPSLKFSSRLIIATCFLGPAHAGISVA